MVEVLEDDEDDEESGILSMASSKSPACKSPQLSHPTASASLEDSPDLGTTEPDKVRIADDDVFKMSFSGLEVQRSQLESRVGTDALLKVYRMMVEFDGKSLDDRLVYSDFQGILQQKHGDDEADQLIGSIFQLVVADQMFNNQEGAATSI